MGKNWGAQTQRKLQIPGKLCRQSGSAPLRRADEGQRVPPRLGASSSKAARPLERGGRGGCLYSDCGRRPRARLLQTWSPGRGRGGLASTGHEPTEPPPPGAPTGGGGLGGGGGGLGGGGGGDAGAGGGGGGSCWGLRQQNVQGWHGWQSLRRRREDPGLVRSQAYVDGQAKKKKKKKTRECASGSSWRALAGQAGPSLLGASGETHPLSSFV